MTTNIPILDAFLTWVFCSIVIYWCLCWRMWSVKTALRPKMIRRYEQRARMARSRKQGPCHDKP